MTGDQIITWGMVLVLFAIVIAILYITYRRDTSFTDYAVGGRAFGPWYIAMSYNNSWWPGTVWIAFFGLTAASGVIGFYALLYSLLGVTVMYLMANHAWTWGKRFNLRTQPDMLGLRFNSRAVKVVASAIGVIALFPWIVLLLQAMGALFQWVSLNKLSATDALIIGVVLIAIRQYWTVRMGMRGIVITDLFQGIVAYPLCALLCLLVLIFYFHGFNAIHRLPASMFTFPGVGSSLGPWYLSAIILTGIIGSLSWPTSFQRIYTAHGVRSVKQGTVYSLPIMLVFYGLLSLIALSAATLPAVAKAPQSGWFIAMQTIGGTWLLGLGCVMILAASMGWVDGCIQVCGLQIANDIVGTFLNLPDKRLTAVAKASMVFYLVAGAIVARVAFNYAHLVDLAIISYQGIIQLAVPMFLGLFWKGGNKQGALAGMISGFVAAAILTHIYPNSIPALGGITSGIVGLAVNLVAFLACHFVFGQSKEEQTHVKELFAVGRAPAIVSTGRAASPAGS